DDVVARHESLRTVFVEVEGVPEQKILAPRPGMWRCGDMVAEAAEDEIIDALKAMAAHRFDLATEIPIRAKFLALGPQRYVLGIVLHHIAFDGWSMAPMVRDVMTAYAARRQGVAPRWVGLPVQYADYSLWQREYLGDLEDPGSRIWGQLAYWQQELADLPEVVSL
ncbi:condensation domain-containing protein, partial [Mycolicibacterium hassiacum]